MPEPALKASPDSQPSDRSTLATMGPMVVGWALLKLLVGSYRETPAREGFGVNRKSGLGEKQHADPSEAKESGRGRRSRTPATVPPPGWKDILWRVYEQFQHDRVMAVAAGVTFYALLALFPAVAALVSIYGLFADPATIQEHLNTLSGVLPGGALEVVGEQVKRIASKGGGALGFGFVFGLAISLWSANAGMKAVFDALNIVYDEEEKRSFVRLTCNPWPLRSEPLPSLSSPSAASWRSRSSSTSSASAAAWNGSSFSGAGRSFSSSLCSALPFSTATAPAATPRSGLG